MPRRTKQTKYGYAVTRRRKRVKPRWKRIGRTLLMLTALVAVLIAMGAVLAKAARPYLISYSEVREIANLKKEITQAKAEHEALKREAAYLATPRGMTAEARKLGWVKKGEVALVVGEPEDSKEETESPDSGSPSFWQTAGHRILQLFGRDEQN